MGEWCAHRDEGKLSPTGALPAVQKKVKLTRTFGAPVFAGGSIFKWQEKKRRQQ